MIGAYSARSRAYAQAIQYAGLKLDSVIVYGDQNQDNAIFLAPPINLPDNPDIFYPDLNKPLLETCREAGWPVTFVDNNDINSTFMVSALKSSESDLYIFSGYGGQIIKSPILDFGINLLHLHAGWLPDYRGSTTIYYSWLLEGRCGVTALLLNSGIDTGPILARRHYPSPPPGVDVDLLYDSSLRADLLVDVLWQFNEYKTLSNDMSDSEGQTYYVIHPVLKHIALLSREERKSLR